MKTRISSVAAFLVVLALGSTLTAANANAANAASAANEDKHPLFDRIDTNHDGFISLQEWITARHEFLTQHRAAGEEGGARSTMTSLNHRSPGGTGTTAGTTPVTATTTAGSHPRLQEEDENHHPLFDRIDSNHDGQISLQEWITFRRAHHGEHRRPGTTPTTSGVTPPTTPTTTLP